MSATSGMLDTTFQDLDVEQLSMFVAALAVESAFYGVYAILFGTCVCILCKRRQKSPYVIFLITAVVMFGLSTGRIIFIFYKFFFAIHNISPLDTFGPIDYTVLSILEYLPLGVMYVTNNVIADGLIVYRCYMVWDYRKSVIIVPALLVIATGVYGYILPLSITMISLSLVTNVLVTALTAGRIWWISRRTKAVLGRKHSQKYNASIAIIVESGFIYSISLVVFIIALELSVSNGLGQKDFPTVPSAFVMSLAPYIVYSAVAQIVGIVPTLIIVRVGLGLSAQDPETFKSTSPPAPEFGRANPPSSQPLATNLGDVDRENDLTLKHIRGRDSLVFSYPSDDIFATTKFP